MHIFTVIIIVSPGILAALYYLHITGRKTMPPLKLTALVISFIYLINMFSISLNMIKWYGAGLTVLGNNAVWYNLQFCAKYMLLSAAFAVLLPWIVALFSSFKLEDILSLMQQNIEKNKHRNTDDEVSLEANEAAENIDTNEEDNINE